MSAHTPGPWRLYCTQKDEFVVRKMFPDGQEAHQIAVKVRGYGNARLIAAAPELLEALKDALDLIDSISPVEGNTVRKARAAIAEATGGGE